MTSMPPSLSFPPAILPSLLITSAIPHSSQSLCELLSLVSLSWFDIPFCTTIKYSNTFAPPPPHPPSKQNVRLETPAAPQLSWLCPKGGSVAYPCLCRTFNFICENLFVGESQAILGGSVGPDHDLYTLVGWCPKLGSTWVPGLLLFHLSILKLSHIQSALLNENSIIWGCSGVIDK